MVTNLSGKMDYSTHSLMKQTAQKNTRGGDSPPPFGLAGKTPRNL